MCVAWYWLPLVFLLGFGALIGLVLLWDCWPWPSR